MKLILLCMTMWTVAAWNVFAHGDLHLQIEEVTKQLAGDPKNADLYLKRGELHRAHQEWDGAQADYDFAFNLSQGKMEVIDLVRGKLFLESNWPLSSLVALDRFIGHHTNHVDALTTRARALVKLERRLDAVQDYTRAILSAAHPEPELFLERCQALTNEGAAFLDRALQGLEEGLKKLGPLPVLQTSAIEVELMQKKFDAALDRVQRVAALFGPRQETWLVRRGEILQMAGRPQEANEAYRAALKALDALPPSRRQVPIMAELEHKIRLALETTGGNQPKKNP